MDTKQHLSEQRRIAIVNERTDVAFELAVRSTYVLHWVLVDIAFFMFSFICYQDQHVHWYSLIAAVVLGICGFTSLYFTRVSYLRDRQLKQRLKQLRSIPIP